MPDAGQPAPLTRRLLAPGNFRGILLMAAYTVFMAAMHAAVRHVSDGLHPFEITFFRCAFGFLVVVPWLARSGLGSMRTERFSLHLGRSAVNICGMLTYFYALSIAPLAEITALSFLSPLAATALAALMLGERVGIRRWLAILVGFSGALIILRPGFAEVGAGQVLTLVSVCFWAFSLIIIKIMARTDSAVAITGWMSLLMAPMALVPAVFFWTWPTWNQLAWLLFIGIIGNIGQILMTQALKEADTGVVMPIDFFKLVWITIIAYVAFAEVPGIYSWLGGAVIFGAGAYLAVRERKLAAAVTAP